MSSFEKRLERLEFKYLVDEATAERVRRDIEPFCRPDVHNPATGGYGISSLYLDSPGLAMHWAKERGDPDRMKLRIRSYAGSTIRVVERKHRFSEVVDKSRAIVSREEGELAAHGGVPQVDSYEEQRFLDEFAMNVASFGAEPTLHVRYEREAYASLVDSYARVTFDRNISAQRVYEGSLNPEPGGWYEYADHWLREEADRTIVLELKCQTSSIPWWITELVQSNGLQRTSFSKYSVGIYITGSVMGAFNQGRRSARMMQ